MSTSTSEFLSTEFDFRPTDGSGSVWHVTVMAVSGDELADDYIRQIQFDLVLLAFDVTNSRPQDTQTNGTRFVDHYVIKRPITEVNWL